MGASLRPSDAHPLSALEQLVATCKPPKLPDAELERLQIHADGIRSIREALSQQPFQFVTYRDLSRYASKDAQERMSRDETLAALAVENDTFKSVIRGLPERMRKFWEDGVAAMAKWYRPFLSQEIHLWMWSQDVKEAIDQIVGKASIRQGSVFIFVAESLSELVALEEIAKDLKVEAEQGKRCLRILLANRQQINKELCAK